MKITNANGGATPAERELDSDSDRAEHADVYVNVRMHASTCMYVRVRTKFSYRKYFFVSIIQGGKYSVIFNFVVLSDYENISTTEISGFTVHAYGRRYQNHFHVHIDPYGSGYLPLTVSLRKEYEVVALKLQVRTFTEILILNSTH